MTATADRATYHAMQLPSHILLTATSVGAGEETTLEYRQR